MKQRTMIWFLVVVLTVPGLAFAVKKGRLIGKVLDPEGNPIPGVTVVATCAEIPRFKESDTTDKKGIFKLDFSYLEVKYQLVFSKEGFLTFTSEQDWDLVGTAREEFTMYPGSANITEGPLVSLSNQAIYNFNLGVEAFNSGDYPAAEAKFEEALEHDPELNQAWSALGRVYVRTQQYEKAVEATEKAIALGSTDEEVWRARWEAYRNLGDDEMAALALADLESAGLRAVEAKKIYNEGVALSKAGDQAGAFEKFEEALVVDPNLTRALLAVATTGLEIGRFSQSVKAAETILRADPDNEQAMRIRYNAALNLGEEDMLIDALVSLAAIEPAVAQNGLWSLAYANYDAGDEAKAKIQLGKLLEVFPNHPQANYYLGLIYLNEGANEQAKSHLERFVELAPDDPEAPTATELAKYLGEK